MNDKIWAGFILMFAATLWSAPLRADVKTTTDDEAERFEQRCASDPKCSEGWAKLKESAERYKKEMDALCKKDPAACARRKAEDERKFLERVAQCEDLAKDCDPQINAAMDEMESSRMTSPWCAENAQDCDKLKQDRAAREKAGKSWCGAHANICAKARTEQVKRRQKAEHDKKDRETKRQAALVKQKAEEDKLRQRSKKDAAARSLAALKEAQAQSSELERKADRQFIADSFKCIGEPDSCFDQVNTFAEQLVQQREQNRCAADPKTCASSKKGAKPTEKTKKTWCEENVEVCEQIKQKHIDNMSTAKHE